MQNTDHSYLQGLADAAQEIFNSSYEDTPEAKHCAKIITYAQRHGIKPNKYNMNRLAKILSEIGRPCK